jgi:uncharacterized protein YdiU (UPF0061 family)
MKTKIKVITAGVSAAFVTLAVVGGQLSANQQFDKQAILEQLQTFDSSTQEATLILDQYQQNKLPFTYVKNQSEHIDKKVLEFYQTLQGEELEKLDEKKVKKVEPRAFELSINLKLIESSEGKKEDLKKVKSRLESLGKKIEKIEKSYE